MDPTDLFLTSMVVSLFNQIIILHVVAKHHRLLILSLCMEMSRKVLSLASSLARHMYDHNVLKYHCDQCDYGCHFESELQTHKIIHRKNPSYQCMKANCGKWFRHKWDLTLHLQKHDGIHHNCDYERCNFSTKTKK